MVRSGTGGEPIRNPDSYPTGKNFYGIDPDKVPKRESWALGVDLADEMLAQHLAEHGRYPEKVSFVIWGDQMILLLIQPTDGSSLLLGMEQGLVTLHGNPVALLLEDEEAWLWLGHATPEQKASLRPSRWKVS